MKNINRRKFIKNTSTIGASAFAFPAISYSRILGANERINTAVAGLNSRGLAHVIAIGDIKDLNVTAFCDPDSRVFSRAQKTLDEYGGGKAETYADVRKLLENKNIDTITIATPDHWHAPMSIMAMQAGKHVYVEKPVSHNPQEGEWLLEVQKKTGKVLQIGSQQRSAPTSMEAKQDIVEGIIGDVYYGKAWYNNTRGSIGIGKKAAVPKELNWDIWQGPAPRKEYMDNWVHYNWHWFWNWGTGEINNNGLHEIDICRWMLDLKYPNKVTSSGGRFHFNDDWEFYDTQIANYEYNDGKMITWEGRSCNGMHQYERGRGVTIHGTEGSILLDRNTYKAYSHDGKLLKQVNERTGSATTNTMGVGGLDIYHFQNFADAINKGTQLNAPINEAHISTTMCHLGNIAQKYGRVLKFNPNNGSVLNDNEAMSMWKREYEKGWEPKV